MAPIIHLFLAASMLPAGLAASTQSYHARAWEPPAGRSRFPEQTGYEEINCKPNVGISFSGGGARAYLGTIGVLAGLHELDLVEKIKYISSISGSTWATSVYSYHNLTVSDGVFLGKVVEPQNLTIANLAESDPKCARSFTNDFGEFTPDPTLYGSVYEQYARRVQAIYLDPAAIPRHVPFSYDTETVAEIKRTNPTLANTQFLTLKHAREGVDQRPFPIAGITLIGPVQFLPYNQFNRNFTFVEVTPISAGVAAGGEVSFNSVTFEVGGLIEPFAFGLPVVNATGVPSGKKSAMVSVGDVTEPISLIDVLFTATSSSYVVDPYFAASSQTDNAFFLEEFPYWAPSIAGSHSSYPVTFGDGGNYVYDNFLSLIQRGVTKIIKVDNPVTPLSPTWEAQFDSNGNVINLSRNDVSDDLPFFFGQIPFELRSEEAGNFSDPSVVQEVTLYDYTPTQVFPKGDFVPLIKNMQAAQAAGAGCIVKSKHITVHNPYFQIPAGIEVEMVWVYFGRSHKWEDKLVPEVRALLNDTTYGVFPNWPSFLGSYDHTKANLIADHAGWVIKHNEDLFRDFIEGDEYRQRRHLRHRA